jgi:hypothetical protein
MHTFAAVQTLSPDELAERRTRKKQEIAAVASRLIANPETMFASSRSGSSADTSTGPKGKAGKAAAAKAAILDRRAMRAAGAGANQATSGGAALLRLCRDGDPLIRRLAMLSAATVFKDVIPGYRIRPPTAEEATAAGRKALSKDVRRVRAFEAGLLKVSPVSCFWGFM